MSVTERDAALPSTATASTGRADGSSRRPAEAFELDASLRYVAFNAAHAAGMRTVRAAEIDVGDAILDVVPEVDRARLEATLRRALAGEDVVEDVVIVDVNGEERAIRASASPVRSRGSIVGVMAVTEDVTEEVRAAAHQARINRELRAITRCNEVLVRATEEQALLDNICRIICDDAGYRMCWVGYVEHDEAKLIRPVASAGTFPGELETSGITWADTPHGRGPTGVAARTGQISYIQNLETDPLAEPWREDARRYGRRAAVALPLKDEQDTTFGVLSICTLEETFTAEEIRLLEELAGDLAFGIVSIRGRAAQRQLEAQLRQSQKMEVVGQLAGGIAHDFNNLLTAIRGYGELLAGDLDPSQGAALSDVAEVLAVVDRAEALTRNLLAFSRRQAPLPRTVAPGEVVERIVPMLRRLLGQQIELVPDLRHDTGPARVDPGQLEQVVVNLAVNARDAMPEGGRLAISTRLVDVPPDVAGAHPGVRPGPHVEIAVADTGHGMDEVTRARLFEPFFTTKAEGKGTGLGLATVYGIVRQAGGFITVDSRLGEGSEFRVHLPQAETTSWSGALLGTAPSPPPQGTGTVLLVEDDPAVRAYAVRALEQLGYRVLPAATGDDAVDLVAAHRDRIDLVLTDVVMPGMQGPELVRRIREARPGVRCLFASGYADRDGNQFQQLAGSPVLPKPFTIHELAVAVRDAMAL